LLRAIDEVYMAPIFSYSLIVRRRIRARLHGLWKILLYLLLYQCGGGCCCVIFIYSGRLRLEEAPVVSYPFTAESGW
jgi:hypothetical protein